MKIEAGAIKPGVPGVIVPKADGGDWEMHEGEAQETPDAPEGLVAEIQWLIKPNTAGFGQKSNAIMSGGFYRVISAPEDNEPSDWVVPYDEIVTCYEGESRITFEDGRILEIKPKQCVFIPGGSKVKWWHTNPYEELFFYIY